MTRCRYGWTVLGVMHVSGEGADRDYARAVSLFRKACKGGLKSMCNPSVKPGLQ